VRISAIAALSTLALSAPAFASNGGTGVPEGANGGVVYGQAVRLIPARPLLRRFDFSSRRVLVRVDRNGARRVRVSVLLRRGHTTKRLNRSVATGRRVAIALPKLGPGHWTVRLRVSGRTRVEHGRFVIKGVHHPEPPPPPPPPADGGVFPVAGPHTYGDGIGVARKGHTHQGQDIIAAQGTPVVAPVGGTVLYTDYQASAAGYYVVEQATDGRAFFFAHCQKGSVAVAPGQPVATGQRLCLVGHSGDASGPHLHFEIWVGGWRVDKNSQFIDPLATLKSWDR
jgi:murein DD-endopeptidase MepM/ murein hydrolase activator NlpD